MPLRYGWLATFHSFEFYFYQSAVFLITSCFWRYFYTVAIRPANWNAHDTGGEDDF